MRVGSSSLSKAMPSDQGGPRLIWWEPFKRFAFNLLVVALQLGGLFGLSLAGQFLVHQLQLPIPGSLVGMLALFIFLSMGVVRIAWFERTGSFLVKHLAFFFIPITVGLMDAAAILADNGIVILVTLVASAAIGLSASALITQSLIAKRGTLESSS